MNGLPRTPSNADYNNIQPRLGAAYQLNPKTVMRGGWGIFYMSPISRGASNGFSQITPLEFSMTKTTRIRDGMKLITCVELFNALNTPVFSADPNLDPTSPNFGKIFRDNGQSNKPRIIQIGFRFE